MQFVCTQQYNPKQILHLCVTTQTCDKVCTKDCTLADTNLKQLSQYSHSDGNTDQNSLTIARDNTSLKKSL